MEGRTVQHDVIETYVPSGAGTSVVGAFEIYYDITVQREMLAGLVHRSTMIIYGVSLVLFTALLISLGKLCKNMVARTEAEICPGQPSRRTGETGDGRGRRNSPGPTSR